VPRPAARRRFAASGFLVVDKPGGVSSAQVVNHLKRLTGPDRIGHAGTLDPFATGVLVLCFNQATKLAGYLLDQDKVYQGTMRLGLTTDTQDLTGQILKRTPVAVSPEEVQRAAREFTGVINQKPPAYSALKQNGEPLYKKARRGEKVRTESRQVTIHRLEVTRIEPPRVEFEVHCSKGTYIRTLAHDWGLKLGCGGHLEALRRIQSGPFVIDQALILGQIEALARQGRLEQRLIPPAKALDWPGAVVSLQAAQKVVQGQSLDSHELQGLPPQSLKVGLHLKLTNQDGQLIALAKLGVAPQGQGLTARPIRVLQV